MPRGAAGDGGSKGRRRTRKVRSYPVHPLRDALSVAQAIQEANSGLPFDRIVLAGELRTTPSSSGFTMRLNSSARYGLTQGGYNHARISLTEGGRAVVAPKSEEERRLALVECALRPDVFRAFYESLEGRKLPQPSFAQNILERDHGIDPDLTQECLEIILDNGRFVGLIREVGGSQWVSVRSVRATDAPADGQAPPQAEDAGDAAAPVEPAAAPDGPAAAGPAAADALRVFVGHFRCPETAARIQTLLSEFGIESLIADVGRPSGSALTAEISQVMGRCSAAVLVTGASSSDAPGAAVGFMAGAAAALYGPRLLVVDSRGAGRSDLSVPSIELRPDVDASTWSLRLLRALSQSGVIRVSI